MRPIVCALACILSSLAAITGCGSSSRTRADGTSATTTSGVTQLIDAETGGAIHLGAATLQIPPNALEADAEITLQSPATVKPLLTDAVLHGQGFEINPGNARFIKDVSLTIPVEASAGSAPVGVLTRETQASVIPTQAQSGAAMTFTISPGMLNERAGGPAAASLLAATGACAEASLLKRAAATIASFGTVTDLVPLPSELQLRTGVDKWKDPKPCYRFAILSHGINDHGGLWVDKEVREQIVAPENKFVARLARLNDPKTGKPVYDGIATFQYDYRIGPDIPARDLATQLDARANQMFSKEKSAVDLYGHSWGGMISRAFIQRAGGSRIVERLCTIGTPHFGTPLGDGDGPGILNALALNQGPRAAGIDPPYLPWFPTAETIRFFRKESAENAAFNAEVSAGHYAGIDILTIASATPFAKDIAREGLIDRCAAVRENHLNFFIEFVSMSFGSTGIVLDPFSPLKFPNDGAVPLESAQAELLFLNAPRKSFQTRVESNINHPRLVDAPPVFQRVEEWIHGLGGTGAITRLQAAEGSCDPPSTRIYYATEAATGAIREIDLTSGTAVVRVVASLPERSAPIGIAKLPDGKLAVCEFGHSFSQVVIVDVATGGVRPLTTDFSSPFGVAAIGGGDVIVTDAGNSEVVRVRTSDGARTTLAEIPNSGSPLLITNDVLDLGFIIGLGNQSTNNNFLYGIGPTAAPAVGLPSSAPFNFTRLGSFDGLGAHSPRSGDQDLDGFVVNVVVSHETNPTVTKIMRLNSDGARELASFPGVCGQLLFDASSSSYLFLHQDAAELREMTIVQGQSSFRTLYSFPSGSRPTGLCR